MSNAKDKEIAELKIENEELKRMVSQSIEFNENMIKSLRSDECETKSTVRTLYNRD